MGHEVKKIYDQNTRLFIKTNIVSEPVDDNMAVLRKYCSNKNVHELLKCQCKTISKYKNVKKN